MNEKKLSEISNIIFDMLINHEFIMIKYFQLSLGRYLLLLKIMTCYFSKTKLTQEQLILAIPTNVSSRSNTLNILKSCKENNYITKEKSIDDTRSILIVPSAVLVKEYEQYIELTHNTKYN